MFQAGDSSVVVFLFRLVHPGKITYKAGNGYTFAITCASSHLANNVDTLFFLSPLNPTLVL
jgi:hypothetical protein